MKGAPEMIRGFLGDVPADYDATYKRFAAQVGFTGGWRLAVGLVGCWGLITYVRLLAFGCFGVGWRPGLKPHPSTDAIPQTHTQPKRT
jgi:hypothetical protein